MNRNGMWRAPVAVGVTVALVAGCSTTDRKVSGIASAPVDVATPATSTSTAAQLADPATLSSRLGSPAEVAGILGVDLTPGPIFKKPFTNLSTQPITCLEAVMPGQESSVYYMPSGFVAQFLNGGAKHHKLRISELRRGWHSRFRKCRPWPRFWRGRKH